MSICGGRLDKPYFPGIGNHVTGFSRHWNKAMDTGAPRSRKTQAGDWLRRLVVRIFSVIPTVLC